MDRRQFIRNSAGTLSTLTAAEAAGVAAAQAPRTSVNAPGVGRPVRAVSIGFKPGPPLEKIAALVDREGARGTDLIALPETFRGQNDASMETLDGPTVTALSRLAEKHRTYIVAPIDRKDGDKRLNSAVVLDRSGKIAGVYDKLYPFWVEEFERKPPVQPGQSVTVVSDRFRASGPGHLLRRELVAVVAEAVGFRRRARDLAERVFRRQDASVARHRLQLLRHERDVGPRLPGLRHRRRATRLREGQRGRLQHHALHVRPGPLHLSSGPEPAPQGRPPC